MSDGQFDLTVFRKTVEYADYLKSLHAERNRMDDAMERFLLNIWDEENEAKSKFKNVKLTKHPGPRNSLIGAIRLLIATDPEFSVPKNLNDPDADLVSDKLEKTATSLWRVGGEVRGEPLHYDVVLSMLTFAEVHIAITRTKDMVAAAKGASKAAKAQIEEIAELTPYLFDVWDPRTGYPDLSTYGAMTAYYREIETTNGKLVDEFGENAKKVLGTDADNRYATTTICQLWDTASRTVWLKGRDRPMLQEDLATPFIPIVVQLGEGSRIFSKVEYWRQPFLYTLWTSGLWNRQNLMLTVFYTMVFGIGSNPMFLYKSNQPGKKLQADFSVPGGRITIDRDEDYSPLIKNVIDPSLISGMDIADRLAMESTIYSQTLGEPLGKNAPFSMVALLHQAGRLPLVVPQRKSSWAIAQAVKLALRWMRESGGKGKVGYGDFYNEIKAGEIPKQFNLDAKLEVSLPQDKLNDARIAMALTQGDNPLVSNRWTRENILGIGQSEAMTREIWNERAAELKAMEYFNDQMAVMQARRQALTQPEQTVQTTPEEAPQGGPAMYPNIEPQNPLEAGQPAPTETGMPGGEF